MDSQRLITLNVTLPKTLVENMRKDGTPESVLTSILLRHYEQNSQQKSYSTARIWDKRNNKIRTQFIIDDAAKTILVRIGRRFVPRSFEEIEWIRQSLYKDAKKKTISEGDYVRLRDTIFLVVFEDGDFHLFDIDKKFPVAYLSEIAHSVEVIENKYSILQYKAKKSRMKVRMSMFTENYELLQRY